MKSWDDLFWGARSNLSFQGAKMQIYHIVITTMLVYEPSWGTREHLRDSARSPFANKWIVAKWLFEFPLCDSYTFPLNSSPPAWSQSAGRPARPPACERQTREVFFSVEGQWRDQVCASKIVEQYCISICIYIYMFTFTNLKEINSFCQRNFLAGCNDLPRTNHGLQNMVQYGSVTCLYPFLIKPLGIIYMYSFWLSHLLPFVNWDEKKHLSKNHRVEQTKGVNSSLKKTYIVWFIAGGVHFCSLRFSNQMLRITSRKRQKKWTTPLSAQH